MHACGLLALLEPVDAAVALLDDGVGGVEPAGIEGAGGHALLAADALLLVDDDQAVLVLAVGGAGGAHLEAGGVVALLALAGQPVLLRAGPLADGAHAVHGVAIHAQADAVLMLASGDAGVAAGAAVQIDNKAVSH